MTRYRTEVRSAIKAFRPVLMALKMRAPEQYRPVYIAEFDHLHLLDLDSCSLEILVADLDDCSGIFVSSYTKTRLLRNYIILNSSLFNREKQEIRVQLKITGVHEFCHFIAIVYAATAVEIEELKKCILKRLNAKIDKLPKETLIKVYSILSDKRNKIDCFPDELTDKHFRLDIEGNTPDYNILFYHFMFSKELFEIYFTKEHKHRFKDLLKTNVEQAATLLIERLTMVSQKKDVPYELAFNQLLKWVHKYTE
jgi:hypothetical protein